MVIVYSTLVPWHKSCGFIASGQPTSPNSSSTSSVYLLDPNLVVTVPDDALAPYGARPATATVLTKTLYMFANALVAFAFGDLE